MDIDSFFLKPLENTDIVRFMVFCLHFCVLVHKRVKNTNITHIWHSLANVSFYQHFRVLVQKILKTTDIARFCHFCSYWHVFNTFLVLEQYEVKLVEYREFFMEIVFFPKTLENTKKDVSWCCTFNSVFWCIKCKKTPK